MTSQRSTQPVPALEVWLSGHKVGLIQRTGTGLIRFVLHDSWIAQGQRPRLGLPFLRSSAPRTTGSGLLPAWFENLLPETDSALRERLARLHGVRTSDSLGLLAVLGQDLPGAVVVKYCADNESEESLLTAAQPAVAEEPLPRRLRFSLAGMQLKLSMAASGNRFVLPGRGEQGEHYIVKLPGQEYPDLPDIEAITMQWARLAGHDVPTNFAFDTDRIDGLPTDWPLHSPRAYAIRRFDRYPGGIRIHHEDFCQALEAWPQDKYGDRPPHFTYDKLLLLVADAAGTAAAQQFAARLGFVIACGNDDAHLKNWSFMWGAAERPALSPCYDLVATVSWQQFGWNRRPGYHGPRLALTIGRVSHFSQLDQQALLRHQARSEQPWARDAIMTGVERARAAWSSIEADAPASMQAAIRQHWKFVPILREAGGLP